MNTVANVAVKVGKTLAMCAVETVVTVVALNLSEKLIEGVGNQIRKHKTYTTIYEDVEE